MKNVRAGPSNSGQPEKLEAKPSSERYDTAAKSRPKVRVGNVVRDAGRVEVQIVEHVVGVKAEL